MEEVYRFWLQINDAPGLVWSLATLMAVVSGYMLHTYVEDLVVATISGFVMFGAILVGHVAFTNLGVLFTADKHANIAASAGAAICSVTLITILMMRLWNAAYLLRNRPRDNPVQGK